jgi:hypothetical protein
VANEAGSVVKAGALKATTEADEVKDDGTSHDLNPKRSRTNHGLVFWNTIQNPVLLRRWQRRAWPSAV